MLRHLLQWVFMIALIPLGVQATTPTPGCEVVYKATTSEKNELVLCQTAYNLIYLYGKPNQDPEVFDTVDLRSVTKQTLIGLTGDPMVTLDFPLGKQWMTLSVYPRQSTLEHYDGYQDSSGAIRKSRRPLKTEVIMKTQEDDQLSRLHD